MSSFNITSYQKYNQEYINCSVEKQAPKIEHEISNKMLLLEQLLIIVGSCGHCSKLYKEKIQSSRANRMTKDGFTTTCISRPRY